MIIVLLLALFSVFRYKFAIKRIHMIYSISTYKADLAIVLLCFYVFFHQTCEMSLQCLNGGRIISMLIIFSTFRLKIQLNVAARPMLPKTKKYYIIDIIVIRILI